MFIFCSQTSDPERIMDAQVSMPKRAKISQSEIPNVSFVQASKIAQTLWDNFAGKAAAPHQVAMALELSPTSGGWRNLCGSSIAYGLSEGGYAASTIELTPLGRRVVAPTKDGDDMDAIREAVLTPRILNSFFTQYDRAKFPKTNIAENVIVGMGIPKERAAAVVNLIIENGKHAGFITDTKTGLFVAIEGMFAPTTPKIEVEDDGSEAEEVDTSQIEISPKTVEIKKPEAPVSANSNVFITHGKNIKVLEQIKKVVKLGGFEPIVSVQTESTAKPIPDKVMGEMRSCGAAVIHVSSEGTYNDSNGIAQILINPNVLIEIGAAMALYKDRFVLVVENGIKLPSNLQGLYECRYSGDDIGLDAGLKILEALRGLNS
jgi:predicted nucleotide-binding protein